jgi:hypothetical protein
LDEKIGPSSNASAGERGVRRVYAIFNNCYQNFGIMNATTKAAILSKPERFAKRT